MMVGNAQEMEKELAFSPVPHSLLLSYRGERLAREPPREYVVWRDFISSHCSDIKGAYSIRKIVVVDTTSRLIELCNI